MRPEHEAQIRAKYKEDGYADAFASPGGYWVALRKDPAGEWLVSVYNFATWKHHQLKYSTEAEARMEYIRWLL